MKVQRIKEGESEVYNLFFSFVADTADGGEAVGFLKGKPGNNVAEGFLFTIPAITTWQELESLFLLPQAAPFWIERNGFHVEKYFARMAEFWKHLEGAPSLPSMNLSGRLSLPFFQEKLTRTFPGFTPEAWENY